MSTQPLLELFRIVSWSSVAVTIGGFLLFILALRCFPRLAELTRRIVVWQLNHAKLPKGSLIQQHAFQLAAWLSQQDQQNHMETSLSTNQSRESRAANLRRVLTDDIRVQGMLAENRCYETWLARRTNGVVSRPGDLVIKHSLNRRGDQLLVKEMAVLDFLREQADAKVYANYLPVEAHGVRKARRQVNAFTHDPQFVTARQLRNRFPQGLAGEHLGWMFNRMLESLGFIHRQGTVHGAMLPQHLLFGVESHGLQIVDWTQAKKTGRPFTWLPGKDRTWYPVEALHGGPAVPASDIYMAAKNLIYLAGAVPASNQLPAHFPVPMQRFITACLLNSPNMRPDDAWELHEEFSEILEVIYGPPKFHQLQI